MANKKKLKLATGLSERSQNAITEALSSESVNRNIKIGDRRTSIRLETGMWNALYEIAREEGCTVNDLCTAIYENKEGESTFTSTLRVFLINYFRGPAGRRGRRARDSA